MLVSLGLALTGCITDPPPDPAEGQTSTDTEPSTTTNASDDSPGTGGTSGASTGEGSGGSSTTAGPADSSEGGTTDGTGGTDEEGSSGGAGPAYNECSSDEDCVAPFTRCLQDPGGMGVPPINICTLDCTQDTDCPPPPSGSATATCEMPRMGDPWCALPCSNGESCPSGMDCVPIVPGFALCMWVEL